MCHAAADALSGAAALPDREALLDAIERAHALLAEATGELRQRTIAAKAQVLLRGRLEGWRGRGARGIASIRLTRQPGW